MHRTRPSTAHDTGSISVAPDTGQGRGWERGGARRMRPSVASRCACEAGGLAAYLRSYASSASSHRCSFSYHDSCAPG